MSDTEMCNTETLSVISRWKGALSVPSAEGKGARDVTIKLPVAMAKFWHGFNQTLEELRRRETELKQGGSQAQSVLKELKKEQARLVQMQQHVYEAHQKGREELHAYLEANYQQFQIAGTDFALHLYNCQTPSDFVW
jgi:hypothetical protein